MRFLIGFLFAAAMMVFTSATAFAAPTCFSSFGVSSFETVGSDILRVRASGGTYDLTLGFCSQLRWAHSIAFDSFGSQVCRGDRVILSDFGGRQLERCTIDEINQH